MGQPSGSAYADQGPKRAAFYDGDPSAVNDASDLQGAVDVFSQYDLVGFGDHRRAVGVVQIGAGVLGRNRAPPRLSIRAQP